MYIIIYKSSQGVIPHAFDLEVWMPGSRPPSLSSGNNPLQETQESTISPRRFEKKKARRHKT